MSTFGRPKVVYFTNTIPCYQYESWVYHDTFDRLLSIEWSKISLRTDKMIKVHIMPADFVYVNW